MQIARRSVQIRRPTLAHTACLYDVETCPWRALTPSLHTMQHTLTLDNCMTSQQELSAAAEMGDRFATIDIGRKVGGGGCCAPFRGGAGFPSNTMSPGPRPISISSGILIHPTVWPQYTNVTDIQDRQRSRSIGRTVTCNSSPKKSTTIHSDQSEACRPVQRVIWCWRGYLTGLRCK